MTEEYKPVPEDIKRYRAIALAQEYAKEGNRGGLEQAVSTFLTKGLGVKLNHDARDLAASLNPNFRDNFYEKYQKSLNSISLRNFRELYDGLFKEYFTEEDLQKADSIFDSDETYASFMEKYNLIKEVVQSKTSRYSKKEKEKAMKELMILNRVALPLEEFEKLEIDKMRNPINKGLLKGKLKEIYNPKEEEKEEE